MTKPLPLQNVDPSRLLELDVRGDLRNGRDPFQRIMHARRALADDGILVLRAIFEPRPLYAVLAGEGFDHWAERLADDDWRVWFYQDDATAARSVSATDDPPLAPPVQAGPARKAPPSLPVVGASQARTGEHREPNCGTPRPEPADMTELDVRGLEPPEPMVRTLESLAEMPVGHTLVQCNTRVPRMLLPELDARGFQYTVREEETGFVRVFIRHKESLPVLDVRILPPREKHPAIFETFDALEPGEAFILLNDHDPVPLRYQFQSERPEAFSWTYRAEGPEIWRVEISRTA